MDHSYYGLRRFLPFLQRCFCHTSTCAVEPRGRFGLPPYNCCFLGKEKRRVRWDRGFHALPVRKVVRPDENVTCNAERSGTITLAKYGLAALFYRYMSENTQGANVAPSDSPRTNSFSYILSRASRGNSIFTIRVFSALNSVFFFSKFACISI